MALQSCPECRWHLGFGSNHLDFHNEWVAAKGLEQAAKKTEVRTTSSTGGQKGVKLARFDLIPPNPLHHLAEHYGRGALKYDDHQWRKGYEWSKSIAAAARHFNAFVSGEDWDVCPENGEGCQEVDSEGNPFAGVPSEHGKVCYNHTGGHHIDAFNWHGFALREFYDRFPEHDDRYKEK